MSVTFKHVPSILALTLTLAACGDTSDEAISSAVDGGEVADVSVDAPVTDVGTSVDVAVAVDVAPAEPDTAAPQDVAKADVCPGGPGCVCKENSDCDAALCIGTPEGKQCAQTCVDKCPDGFKCAQATVPGGDVLSICLPRYGRLCNPCAASKDCQSLGMDGAACLNQGGHGAFCGIPCAADGDCPNGYGCQEASSTENAKSKQCVRLSADGDAGNFGLCPCSKVAVVNKLATSCLKVVKDGDGKVVGQCKGQRTCLAAGLSPCAAPDIAPEVCDGQDNDCDGQVDDQACDDNDVCTVDSCDPTQAKGGATGCVHAPVTDGLPCDADGTVCTDGDGCKAGKCMAGKLLVCDDNNPCTKDACDMANGCTQTSFDALPCSDENPCTIGDKCQAGNCVAGKEKVCTTSDPCVFAKCDVTKDGKCSYTNKKAGAACDDGDACTDNDGCQDGNCQGAKVDCDDGDACTNDSCAPKVGCSYTANAGKCDDGDKCTIGDTCKDKQCLAGKAKICDDNELCTVDSCDGNSGKCIFAGATKDASPCNADDSVCTVGDICKQGACTAGAKKKCDDGNVCTTDGCDKKTGCTALANTTPCDADGDGCTVGDVCKDKQCLPGKKTACDDGSPCTVDGCDKKTGKCVFDGKPQEGMTCDADGSVCTAGDSCKGGKCAAGPAKKCDDGNVCTTEGCEAKTGCSHLANAEACDADGNACTVADTCKAKTCVAGTLKVCDDKNSCTVDSCDGKTGKCVLDKAKLDNKACDADGSVCTVNDYCKAGACTAGVKQDCNDKNPCTADSCDAKKGCTHAANTASCEDGDPCTLGDGCVATKCVAGKAKVCDDSNPCTANDCNKNTGKCLAKALDGKACDADGSVCTVADSCKASTCSAGAAKVCADANVCTDDGCDKKKGCVFGNNGKLCPDASKCTEKEACKAGKCVTSAVLCDDKNPCTKDSCDGKVGCGASNLADETSCSADAKKWCKTGKCVLKAVCGDGKIEGDEQCDDGNLYDGDMCTKICTSFVTKGLVAYYDMSTLDGAKLSDLSGNKHHGTFVGDTYKRNDGLLGGSWYFKGQGSHVSLPAATVIKGKAARSMTFWIKLEVTGGSDWRYSFSFGAESNHKTFSGRFRPDGSLGFMGHAHDHDPAKGAKVIDGKWHFVAYTYNGSELINYVDGSKVNWSANIGALNTQGTSARLARHVGGAKEALVGALDEFRIYDRVLSPSEVETLYKGPAAKCGNKLTEPGETCDDGNVKSGDGCSSACQLSRAVFDYKAKLAQTWVVPAGVTTVHVRMWAAAGGGSNAESKQFPGGPGGYSDGVVAVTPGEKLTILVGQGGGRSSQGFFNAFPNAGMPSNRGGYSMGGGGGRSALQRGATELLVAGGGGGAGGTGWGSSYTTAGGGGGGSSGEDGSPGGIKNGYGTACAGKTGNPVKAGNGGQCSGFKGNSGGKNAGGNGLKFPGPGNSGGGGGDGYYGGGAGALHAGGGGGSGYVHPKLVKSGKTLTATAMTTPPQTASDDYAVGVGVSAANSNGGNGRVVIHYEVECGNGFVQGLEQCDDGNAKDGDGCSALCAYEPMASCKVVRDTFAKAPSGVYPVDPDGAGGKAAFPVYCEMDIDGGGWTLILNHLDGTWRDITQQSHDLGGLSMAGAQKHIHEILQTATEIRYEDTSRTAFLEATFSGKAYSAALKSASSVPVAVQYKKGKLASKPRFVEVNKNFHWGHRHNTPVVAGKTTGVKDIYNDSCHHTCWEDVALKDRPFAGGHCPSQSSPSDCPASDPVYKFPGSATRGGSFPFRKWVR